MNFCDIHINIIYRATICTLDVYLPQYQIIIMLETSTLLTVDKNEQTLVERLINYLQDITTLTVQQIVSMFPKDVCFIFTAITVRNKHWRHDSAADHWATNHIAYLKTWGRRFS